MRRSHTADDQAGERQSARWRRLPRLFVIVTSSVAVAAVGSAGVLVSAGSARSGTHRLTHAHTQRHRVARMAVVQSCWSGTTPGGMSAQPTYDLGATYAGLSQTYAAEDCAPDPRQTFDATHMPGDNNTVPYYFTAYGTCDATSEEGCAPPLVIETWPICADNMSGSAATGGFNDRPQAILTLGSLMASQHLTLAGLAGRAASSALDLSSLTTVAGQVPVAEYGGGSADNTSIEVYIGSTTIRIFAGDVNVAEQAAVAVGAKALVSLAAQGAPLGNIGSSAHGGGCGA